MRITQAFEGARVLVTGASGFLGTALATKVLSSLPNVGELLLLVRSKPGAPAAERVRRRVLGSNAFESLRARDDWPALEAKVRTLDGDLRSEHLGLNDDDFALLAGVDLVIHGAATVAFDAPVDDAFETNLVGPIRLLDTLAAAGAKPRRIVHVSTAYVAGLVKGHVPGGTVDGYTGSSTTGLAGRARFRTAGPRVGRGRLAHTRTRQAIRAQGETRHRTRRGTRHRRAL